MQLRIPSGIYSHSYFRNPRSTPLQRKTKKKHNNWHIKQQSTAENSQHTNFNGSDAQAARFQHDADAAGGDAFPEAAHHASGDQNILHFKPFSSQSIRKNKIKLWNRILNRLYGVSEIRAGRGKVLSSWNKGISQLCQTAVAIAVSTTAFCFHFTRVSLT